MATLVLTAAGGLFGGPVGAAVGGLIGNTIDREVLFKPKGREGPRLSDLRVQTSSYGTQIPRIFGTMRVAGSVIWATDLVEHRASQSAGKGRPGTTTYSYTASFAVALSARPVIAVGRIWADGKLLRGSEGDLKVRTGFRLHPGSEEQAPDPLIVAAEGDGQAPAHRGIAYAVFEDLELADFGNRIPSLTFEVIADAGVTLGDIAAALGGGEVASEAGTPAIRGFAASGASVRAALETLAGAAGGWFRNTGDGLTLAIGNGQTVALADAGAQAGRGAPTRGWRAVSAVDQAPDRVTLTYYDPQRDYQTGVQRAGSPTPGGREARVELPAAASADTAKGIAETALAAFDLRRERRTVALAWDALGVAPGARVTIAGAPGVWRVDRWLFEDMVLRLECVAVAPTPERVAATAGRAVNAADIGAGTTVVCAFELPLLGTSATVPRLAIAAAGTAAGWRSAGLLVSGDGGASWSEGGMTAAPAILGAVVDPPGPAPGTIADHASSLVVQLAHGGMALGDADPAALAGGANLALAGDELLQFASAEPLGGKLWRLHGLWRGRRGTEWAVGAQAAGDCFVLLSQEALVVRDLPIASVGGAVRVLAQGPGDGEAVESIATIAGDSMVPPAPVHLRDDLLGDGRTRLRWVRRSRSGWDWIDGVDVPLGEETERYRITIQGDDTLRTIETTAPELILDAGERAAPLAITVVQLGANGASRAATLALSAIGE